MERREAVRIIAASLAAPFAAACADRVWTEPKAPGAPAGPDGRKYVYWGKASAGMSLQDAIRSVGLNPSSVNEVVNGRSQPRITTISGTNGNWRLDVNGSFFSENVAEKRLDIGDSWGAWLF